MRKRIVWAALKYSVGFSYGDNTPHFCYRLKKMRFDCRFDINILAAFDGGLYSKALPHMSKIMIRQSIREMRTGKL